MVGHSDVNQYQIWHWNGKKWQNIAMNLGVAYSLSAIQGYSANDIWVVGNNPWIDFNTGKVLNKGFVAHYDGYRWTSANIPKSPICISIWGSSSNNLFVGCDSGVVLHYNGSEWIQQNTGTYAIILSIAGNKAGDVFAVAWQRDKQPYDTTYYYFFQYENEQWNIKDTYFDYPYSPPGKFGYRLWMSPEGILFSVGEDGLYQFQNNTWIRIIAGKYFYVKGKNSKNFFITGPPNNILHFKSGKLERYDFFNNYYFDAGLSIWLNEKYIFLPAQNWYQSYFIRGRLK